MNNLSRIQDEVKCCQLRAIQTICQLYYSNAIMFGFFYKIMFGFIIKKNESIESLVGVVGESLKKLNNNGI